MMQWCLSERIFIGVVVQVSGWLSLLSAAGQPRTNTHTHSTFICWSHRCSQFTWVGKTCLSAWRSIRKCAESVSAHGASPWSVSILGWMFWVPDIFRSLKRRHTRLHNLSKDTRIFVLALQSLHSSLNIFMFVTLAVDREHVYEYI